MFRQKFLCAAIVCAFLLPNLMVAQPATVGTSGSAAAPAKVYTAPKEVIDMIRGEGLKRSQVMQHLSYLTDVIGGRLTNSPNMKRANEWTRDTMAKWGMQKAKLEAWGPFGRGWSLKSFSAEVNTPTAFPVIAFPKAWSTSTKGAVTSDVVYLEVNNEQDFAKYKGQLRGKIVLIARPRELKADWEGMAVRYTDEELAKMAAAPMPGPPGFPGPAAGTPSAEQQERLRQLQLSQKILPFVSEEGAAVLVDNSRIGSGGTLFVSSASVAPLPAPAGQLAQPGPGQGGGQGNRGRNAAYNKDNESRIIPQITMASEDYNRLVRMIKTGIKPTMTVNIQAQYHDEDLMGYNTVAEIPGTDPKLKEELVMLGGHLDSWHSSTGATDNAAGCAVMMEAARILVATGLKPRRTVRVALWSGEEQGLNGSREYVTQQFGSMKPSGTPGQPAELVTTANYDKFSAYYNLDNGTGKIRGVYMQGNPLVRPYFEAWFAPFADLGAKTLTLSNTSGTDHLSFDRVGLPGFQFIQDEIEYDTRTHHSNQDNFDRIQADDMKQAATIIAAFVYQTAMMDEKMPRKPTRLP